MNELKLLPDREVRKKPALVLSILASFIVCAITGYFTIKELKSEISLRDERVAEFIRAVELKIGIFDYASADLLARSFVNADHAEAVYLFDTYGNKLTGYPALHEQQDGSTSSREEEQRKKEFLFQFTLSSGATRSAGSAIVYYLPINIYKNLLSAITVGIAVFFCTFFASMVTMQYYIRKSVSQPLNSLLKSMETTLETGDYVPVEELGPSLLGQFAKIYNNFQHELLDSRQKLHQARKLEAIGNLTGSVAHEFNNILAVILANIEMTMIGLSGKPDATAKLEKAQDACISAADIIEQLLSYSRNDYSGREEQISVDKLFTQVLVRVSPFVNNNVKLTFTNNADDMRLPGKSYVIGAMVNLVKNSIESFDIGQKGNIQVSASLFDDRGVVPLSYTSSYSFVRLDVYDDGSGVPDDFQERLFEPFASTKSRQRGTGLGLWSIFNFAQSVGGSITYQDNPGGGSHFSLYLPAKFAKDCSDDQPIRGTARGATVENTRILLVEDEDDLRSELAEFFSVNGNEVSVVSELATARQEIENSRYDILICDLKLPDGSGLDIIRSFRQTFPGARTVLISGNLDLPDNFRGNVDLILTKPVSLFRLNEALCNLMHRDLTESRSNHTV